MNRVWRVILMRRWLVMGLYMGMGVGPGCTRGVHGTGIGLGLYYIYCYEIMMNVL